MKNRIFAASMMLVSLTGPTMAQSKPTLEQANLAYYTGEYARSLQLYGQLASSGNAEAAERAGFMLLQANGHYGPHVRRDVNRAMSLITQAARSDRVGAGFQLNMLELTE